MKKLFPLCLLALVMTLTVISPSPAKEREGDLIRGLKWGQSLESIFALEAGREDSTPLTEADFECFVELEEGVNTPGTVCEFGILSIQWLQFEDSTFQTTFFDQPAFVAYLALADEGLTYILVGIPINAFGLECDRDGQDYAVRRWLDEHFPAKDFKREDWADDSYFFRVSNAAYDASVIFEVDRCEGREPDEQSKGYFFIGYERPGTAGVDQN